MFVWENMNADLFLFHFPTEDGHLIVPFSYIEPRPRLAIRIIRSFLSPPFFSPKPVLYVASSACVLCVLAYPDPGACFSLSPTHQTVARQRFMLVAGLASRKEAAARAAAQAADVKARAGRMRAADGDAADNEESNGGDIGRACREPPLVCFLAIVRAPPASGLTDGRSALAPGFFCFLLSAGCHRRVAWLLSVWPRVAGWRRSSAGL